MSDDAGNFSPVESSAMPATSFLQQYRLHLIGVAVLILLIFSLLAGVAIGMAKRHFEKKFYLEQIEKLKQSLSTTLERGDEMEQEIKELKIDLRAKLDHVAELEAKLKEHDRNEPSATRTEGGELAGSGDAGVDYLRLKAGDCVVDGSSAATASKWRECLQKAKKSPAGH